MEAKKTPKRILWLTEYDAPSGFSKISKAILPLIADGDAYEIFIIDTAKSSGEKYLDKGVTVIGRRHHGDFLAMQRLNDIGSSFDAVVMVNQIWNIKEHLTWISRYKNIPKIFIWFPIEYAGYDANWFKGFNLVHKAFTFTPYSAKEAEKCLGEVFAGDELEEQVAKLEVLPLGINHIFKPAAKKEIPAFRKQLTNGVDSLKNDFVFLNAHANTPGKRLDITMQAFAQFAKKKKNVWLWLHTGMKGFVDIPALAERLGIDDKIALSHDGPDYPVWSDADMNMLYNACNVGLNSSMGESWGYANVDHAATGKPQIVPAHSAQECLFKKTGVLVPAKTNYTFDAKMVIGKLMHAGDLAKEMEKLYKNSKTYQKVSNLSVKEFGSKKYSWDAVAAKWKQNLLLAISE